MKKLIDYAAGAAVVFAAFKSTTRPAVTAIPAPEETNGEVTHAAATARSASAPTQSPLPLARWKEVLTRVAAEMKEDNLTTIAAAMTYYGLLALFPAMIAVVSLYGLISDPAAARSQIADFAAALPEGAGEVVTTQLDSIVSSAKGALGFGFVVSLAATLWTVSSGVGALIKVINIAHDETESRSFLKLRLLALGFTVGIILFVVSAVFVITALPAALTSLGVSSSVTSWVVWLRWPALAVALVVGLGLFYRWAPNRTPRQWRWISWGAVIATLLWLVASLGLNLYVANFSSYNETYGTLGGVIVLLLWMFVSALIVLLGAELNAELEAEDSAEPS